MCQYYIAYDLQMPGQNYERLKSAIQNLGPNYRVQYSLWRLSTPFNEDAVFSFLSRFIDGNDRLEVIPYVSSRGTHRLPDIGRRAVVAALLRR